MAFSSCSRLPLASAVLCCFLLAVALPSAHAAAVRIMSPGDYHSINGTSGAITGVTYTTVNATFGLRLQFEPVSESLIVNATEGFYCSVSVVPSVVPSDALLDNSVMPLWTKPCPRFPVFGGGCNLTFNASGDLQLTSGDVTVWHSNTAGYNDTLLYVQDGTGELSLIDSQNRTVWNNIANNTGDYLCGLPVAEPVAAPAPAPDKDSASVLALGPGALVASVLISVAGVAFL